MTTTQACSRSRPASCSSVSAPRSSGGREEPTTAIVRRYLRRVLQTAVAVVVAYVVLFPLALSYVFTHSARALVPPARLGADYENVSFTTLDGLTLRGWYVPSKNHAAVIAAPGRAGRTEARADARPPRLRRRCSSTAAAKAKATATPTPSAGPQTKT